MIPLAIIQTPDDRAVIVWYQVAWTQPAVSLVLSPASQAHLGNPDARCEMQEHGVEAAPANGPRGERKSAELEQVQG